MLVVFMTLRVQVMMAMAIVIFHDHRKKERKIKMDFFCVYEERIMRVQYENIWNLVYGICRS